MKTLHIFLEKELKETLKHKRIFSLVPILILFLPLLNQYIPHSFMTGISPSVFLPYSYLLIGAYSTEFIFEMMNNEYRQKTIEIIWTCFACYIPVCKNDNTCIYWCDIIFFEYSFE